MQRPSSSLPATIGSSSSFGGNSALLNALPAVGAYPMLYPATDALPVNVPSSMFFAPGPASASASAAAPAVAPVPFLFQASQPPTVMLGGVEASPGSVAGPGASAFAPLPATIGVQREQPAPLLFAPGAPQQHERASHNSQSVIEFD